MTRTQLLLTSVVIIIGGCLATFIIITNKQNLPQPTSTITVDGSLVCLPHKNTSPDQPQTLECAIGLKSNDGLYYGLQNISQDQSQTPFTKHVSITGELQPSAANSRYATSGTLHVKTFRINE